MSDAVELISPKETARLTTLSLAEINRRRAAGDFPQPVRLGQVRIAFVRAEVLAWIADRIAKNRIPARAA
jgi:prophage regulatory protein